MGANSAKRVGTCHRMCLQGQKGYSWRIPCLSGALLERGTLARNLGASHQGIAMQPEVKLDDRSPWYRYKLTSLF